MVLFILKPCRRLFLFICFIHWNISANCQSNFNVSDLIITEILADPDPVFGLPDVEFVEFLNRSGQPVDLSGWLFYDGSVRSLPGMIIPAGEFFIVCANSDTLLMQQYGLTAGVSSVSLTNGGEKLSIYDPSGVAIDSIIYSSNWYGSSYKKDGGWSLERTDTTYLCVDERNWKPSVNSAGGTPGSGNSINDTFIDTSSPVLIRAFCFDSVSVTLVFNEIPDPASMQNFLNYQLQSGLSVIGVGLIPDFPNQILIELDTPINKNQIYSLSVSGISDCSGNTILPKSIVKFGLADTSQMTGLIINEVLFNPYNNGSDFIELYNKGNDIIDLSYFRTASLNIETNEIDDVDLISEQSVLLFPGDYIVLTEFSNGVTLFYYSSFPFSFLEVGKLPAMNNDEGVIALLRNSNKVDLIHYNEDDHFELLKDVEGVSLERINPESHSSDPDSWHSAAQSYGYASPGLKNSMYTDDSRKDKLVSVFPEIFSPDHDGVNDLVVFKVNTGTPGYISNLRIYNSSGQVVYSMSKNRLLASIDSFTWDGVSNGGFPAQPGIYIALIELFNLSGEVSYYKLPFVLAVKL